MNLLLHTSLTKILLHIENTDQCQTTSCLWNKQQDHPAPSESVLIFEKALKFAFSLEAAEKDSQRLTSSSDDKDLLTPIGKVNNGPSPKIPAGHYKGRFPFPGCSLEEMAPLKIHLPELCIPNHTHVT